MNINFDIVLDMADILTILKKTFLIVKQIKSLYTTT
jgi:hypothetical protein